MFFKKKEKKVESRIDAFKNTITGLGTNKDARNKNVLVSNNEDIATYEALYDINAIAKKIVDIYPNEATREWIELNNFEEKEKNRFLDELKRLNVKEKFFEAGRYSRLYGAGCLLIIDDSPSIEALKTPLVKPKNIKNLLLFHNFELQASTEKNIDLSSPDFGNPLYYKIMTNSQGIDGNILNIDIHYSRFLFVLGDKISKQSYESNNFFNYGVLGKLYQAIVDWDTSHQFIPNIVSKSSLLVFKMFDMIEVLKESAVISGNCEKGMQIIQDKVNDLNDTITSLSIGLVDAQDELEIVSPKNLSGVKDILERLDNQLTTLCDIPHTILLGESPKGSNSLGNSTTLDWYNKVRIWQEKNYRQPLTKLFDYIAGYLNITDYDFEFRPLWQPTEKEIEETRKITAERDKIYLELGILSAEEIRQSRFGGEKYSPDTTIEGELPELPEEEGENKGADAKTSNKNEKK